MNEATRAAAELPRAERRAREALAALQEALEEGRDLAADAGQGWTVTAFELARDATLDVEDRLDRVGGGPPVGEV